MSTEGTTETVIPRMRLGEVDGIKGGTLKAVGRGVGGGVYSFGLDTDMILDRYVCDGCSDRLW